MPTLQELINSQTSADYTQSSTPLSISQEAYDALVLRVSTLEKLLGM